MQKEKPTLKKFVERLKLSSAVRLVLNMRYLHRLRENIPLYKKHGINRKVWQPLSYSTIQNHSNDLPWLDRQPEVTVNEAPLFSSFTPAVQEQLEGWQANGYLLLPGFFDKQQIEQAQSSIETSLTQKDIKEYHANRLINLYKSNSNIEKIFKDERLLKLLSFVLGKEALPFQTLNFYKSSSQVAHSDAIHLTTEPLGYSLGVWVALEDVIPGSGEFFYYPGSHKLSYIMNSDLEHSHQSWLLGENMHKKYESKVAQIIEEKSLMAETFVPKKGDVLIWHTNLLHGSLPKQNLALSRKSLVMHYFAKGVLCYHEMLERPAVLH